jgi:hypothetical protein
MRINNIEELQDEIYKFQLIYDTYRRNISASGRQGVCCKKSYS